MIIITLEVYGGFRDRTIWKGEEALPVGCTVGELRRRVGLAGRPALVPLVNGRNHEDEGWVLVQGDTVTFVRRSEGG